MKDYTLYILFAYGFTACVLGGLALYTCIAFKIARKNLRMLESEGRSEKGNGRVF